ncbi:hypothetical protein D3C78_1508560 [compost metagenome]
MPTVLRVVPVVAQSVKEMSNQPQAGVEQEDPQYRRHRRSYRIRQDHQRLVNPAAAQHVIHQCSEEQRHDQPDTRHQEAENQRGVKRIEVVRILEQLGKVIQADKLAGQAEGIEALHRIPQRLAGGPQEKDCGDQQLRQHQYIGQPATAEAGTGR